MKFDFVIGNPPYQDNNDTYNRLPPIYPNFYDRAKEIADKFMLISPARFLFNSGLTSKEWNKEMLEDEHLKVKYFEPNSSLIFPSTDIKGGIAILYRSSKENFGAIKEFIPDTTLRSIANKFVNDCDENLPSIMYGGRSDLKFTKNYLEKFPQSIERRLSSIQKKHPNVKKLSPNEEYELKSSSLDVLFDCGFSDTRIAEDDYKILGLKKGKRVELFIQNKFMTPRYPKRNNIEKYKVFVPESNGSGAIGEVLSTPLIGTPLMSATPTFISIGCFDSVNEAENLLKYIKSKFARVLLGILKKTQHNPSSAWAYVPLQNFSDDSDIDWSQPISKIDEQLYKKYKLSEEEITFIETNVKEMA